MKFVYYDVYGSQRAQINKNNFKGKEEKKIRLQDVVKKPKESQENHYWRD